MKIFVGCSASEDIPGKYRLDCNMLLDELFRENNDLVFGACNSGIMSDAYMSALGHGRNIVGICPEAYVDDFKDLKCTTEITTKNVNERTDGLIRESDVLLFLPGGFGSVYELFTAIESKRCHEHSREIIIYNSEVRLMCPSPTLKNGQRRTRTTGRVFLPAAALTRRKCGVVRPSVTWMKSRRQI